MIQVELIDGHGSGNSAMITALGQLVTAPVQYNQSQFVELSVIDAAFNFYEPEDGKRFVLTGMLVFADKQVSSTTNATVVIYEASAADTADVKRTLLQFEIGQNQSIVMTHINLLISEGVWINAKTDDDDVHMTLLGYYVNKAECCV